MDVWIGGSKLEDGTTWTWTDGSQSSFTQWAPDFPTSQSSAQCISMNIGRTPKSMWINTDCSMPKSFVCEIELVDTTCSIQTYQQSTTTSPPSTTTTSTSITIIPTAMTDCYDWRFINGSNTNGIYRINPMNGLEPFDVYCDMTTEGGGWTVIQSLEFWNNTWNEYKNGFNNGLMNNVWLGNDRIHILTNIHDVILRIEIFGDQNPNSTLDNNIDPNIYLYGEYNFSISNEINNYTLQISQPIAGNASYYSEDGPDEFYWNNGIPFSTGDKASIVDGDFCAIGHQYGGWWFTPGCTFVALNGKYNLTNGNGFRWWNLHIGRIFPKRSEMKIRRL